MSAPGLPSTNEEAWALAGRWGASRYMTPFEALMWRIEEDPRLRSTMTVVYLLDTTPDWNRLVAAHEWASRLIPRVRQRVVDPPLGLGAPTWVVDDDFDLAFHLRRVRPVFIELGRQQVQTGLQRLPQAVAFCGFARQREPGAARLGQIILDVGKDDMLQLRGGFYATSRVGQPGQGHQYPRPRVAHLPRQLLWL